MRLITTLIFTFICKVGISQIDLNSVSFTTVRCYYNETDTAGARYSFVKDSLLKRHYNRKSVMFTSTSGLSVSNTLIFKERGKWFGILFNDMPALDEKGRAIHKVFIKKFDADTIGPHLLTLDVYNLKEHTVSELAEFYNRKMRETGNAKIDYDLPYCSHSTVVSITTNGKTVKYTDCLYSNSILRSNPDINKFANAANYFMINLSYINKM